MPDQTEIDSEKKFQEPLKNRWEVISKLDKIAEKAGLKNIIIATLKSYFLQLTCIVKN